MNHFGVSPGDALWRSAVICFGNSSHPSPILTGYWRWLGARLRWGAFTVAASFIGQSVLELGAGGAIRDRECFSTSIWDSPGGFLLVAWHDLRDRAHLESLPHEIVEPPMSAARRI